MKIEIETTYILKEFNDGLDRSYLNDQLDITFVDYSAGTFKAEQLDGLYIFQFLDDFYVKEGV